jgi:hypothetical protein
VALTTDRSVELNAQAERQLDVTCNATECKNPSFVVCQSIVCKQISRDAHAVCARLCTGGRGACQAIRFFTLQHLSEGNSDISLTYIAANLNTEQTSFMQAGAK